MVNLDDWRNSYQNLHDVRVHTPASATGACRKVVGGRLLYAEVDLSFAKSAELEFCSALRCSAHERACREGWLTPICFGVLDTMLVRPITPVTHFRCTITDIRFHELDSSAQAFRVAGRLAAEDFLNRERFAVL